MKQCAAILLENSAKKNYYKQAVAVNSSRYYNMIHRYQVTREWKRLKRTLQLLRCPVSHAKSSQHNRLKEGIDLFACMEGWKEAVHAPNK